MQGRFLRISLPKEKLQKPKKIKLPPAALVERDGMGTGLQGQG